MSGGTWSARLARVGESGELEWFADRVPWDGDRRVHRRRDPDPGQPTLALIGSQPAKFRLPATAVQPVRGGLTDQGYGWDNTLELKVRTIRVEPCEADARTRTGDPFITSEVLYQLSYVGNAGLV